jgi:hypothetical protein
MKARVIIEVDDTVDKAFEIGIFGGTLVMTGVFILPVCLLMAIGLDLELE